MNENIVIVLQLSLCVYYLYPHRDWIWSILSFIAYLKFKIIKDVLKNKANNSFEEQDERTDNSIDSKRICFIIIYIYQIKVSFLDKWVADIKKSKYLDKFR